MGSMEGREGAGIRGSSESKKCIRKDKHGTCAAHIIGTSSSAAGLPYNRNDKPGLACI